MPEQLTDFEFTSNAGGGRYDWDTLLDGTIYRLTRGTDFNAKPQSFLTTVRKQADKRNKTVRTQIESDTSLVMQAVDRPPATQ